MRYCNRCVMPSTKPGLVIDGDGICSACRSVEKKHQIDWDERESKLRALCDKVRGSNGNGYECIVPVSGGKDSSYQAYMMSKVYGLKVLCINVSAHLQTYEGISNLNSMVANLGVDLIKINVRPSVQRKIRRYALFELGNPNYAEHQVVFAGVARAALYYGAPLIVWGEDIATEFGGKVAGSASEDGSAEDLINNDLFMSQDFSAFVQGRIEDNELFFYNHPEKEEFRRKNIKSIYLGYYHWWDGYKHFEIAKKFGFVPRRNGPLSGNILDYDNIDEKLCEIHIWFKFLKFGFWRPTDQCCYHIWNGRMKRDEAVELVLKKQYEFPKEYFQEFLEYHQITESQYYECEEKYRNRDIWKKVNGTWRLKTELR
jgi:N-acetyl sugar amidotransferase